MISIVAITLLLMEIFLQGSMQSIKWKKKLCYLRMKSIGLFRESIKIPAGIAAVVVLNSDICTRRWENLPVPCRLRKLIFW
jgi:hypothetical protein